MVLGAGPGGYTAAFRAADLGLEGDAGRALADARRRVPQRRAAYRPRPCCMRPRSSRRRAAMAEHGVGLRPARRSTRRACVTGRTRWSGGSPAASSSWPSSARCGCCGARPLFFRRITCRWSEAGKRARGRRFASASSPQAPSRRASRAAGRSAHHRFHRGAGAASCRNRMLVIGGGIIGLEMATVYDALGVHVSVVELARSAHAGRGSRPAAAARAAHPQALRGHHDWARR